MAVSFPTVRIAAIQATPVILDADASVDKALRLLDEAANDGVQLAVFPELFVPLYESGAWAHDAASFSGWDELWERLWENSVDVPGPLTDRIAGVCSELGVHCAIGVNERESERPGSLYNALLLFGPQGLLAKHRKLMPTMQERLFHGVGTGEDLGVTDTPHGRIGGLICWENMMPLALRGLPGRPADLACADRGRHRRVACEHAAHRDRVGRIRRLGAAVHPRGRLPG